MYCSLFSSRCSFMFWVNNSENLCPSPRQDSKGRTEAVIKTKNKKKSQGMCMLLCIRPSVFCLLLVCWEGMWMVLQCFMVHHKNKWSPSDFNYNGEYATAPHSLVCFCSVSRGSGFDVFSIWLLSQVAGIIPMLCQLQGLGLIPLSIHDIHYKGYTNRPRVSSYRVS